MNPVMKLALALLIGIELSFTPSLSFNLGLIVISLIYLECRHVHWKWLAYLLLVPVIPAAGALITQIMYGAGMHFGWVMATRIYAYVLIGADLVIATTAVQMANALEQNCHLPAKFAFGILSALNLIPQIVDQVKIIKVAAAMRGVHLTWLSPTLYFKAILAAIQWADQLSSALISHGFVENAPRTQYYRFPIRKRDCLVASGAFVLAQILIFV